MMLSRSSISPTICIIESESMPRSLMTDSPVMFVNSRLSTSVATCLNSAMRSCSVFMIVSSILVDSSQRVLRERRVVLLEGAHAGAQVAVVVVEDLGRPTSA